ncbi:MAG TPA: serine--tRNA ligase, partial [Cyclobacteriaceae bacterium]
MLQINVIREQTEKVIEGLKKRYLKDAEELISNVIEIDKQRRETQQILDNLKAKSNTDSKKIGELMKSGKASEAQGLRDAISADKENLKALDDSLQEFENNLQQALYRIPNVPAETVPAGRGADDNITVFEHGAIPTLHADALP